MPAIENILDMAESENIPLLEIAIRLGAVEDAV
jgi:hypothetical protein